MRVILSEILIEQLLEQRNFYLNTLKHLSFQLMTEPSREEIQYIEKVKTVTVDQLKKVEQEIVFLSSKKPS